MFTIGQKVWYTELSGTIHEAVVTGTGQNKGEAVVDVQLTKVAGDRGSRWGYLDQIEARA